MQKHVLDNGVCALAVLHHLLKIAPQCVHQLCDFGTSLIVEACVCDCLTQFLNQLSRDSRKIIHEIERVLDLVCDTGGQLTKRGKLLCLDEAILCGPQVLQRGGQFACARLHAFKQTDVL